MTLTLLCLHGERWITSRKSSLWNIQCGDDRRDSRPLLMHAILYSLCQSFSQGFTFVVGELIQTRPWTFWPRCSGRQALRSAQTWRWVAFACLRSALLTRQVLASEGVEWFCMYSESTRSAGPQPWLPPDRRHSTGGHRVQMMAQTWFQLEALNDASRD